MNMSPRKLIRSIDIDLLNEQKEYLISLQRMPDIEAETIEGILNLMDAISDVYEEEIDRGDEY